MLLATLQSPHLHRVQGSAGAADALHSGDCHASHTAQRSQTGVDCQVPHRPLLLAVAGHHHCARSTPSLPTAQLAARQTH